MPIKDVPYHKPEKHNKSIIHIYKSGEMIEVETRAYESPEHIKKYKKVSARQMINTITGETKDYIYKDIKDSKAVFKIMKACYRLLMENLVGDNTEIIIVLDFDKEMPNLKEVMRLEKNFFEKLKRRIKVEIIFVRILLYKDRNKPYFHLWLKTVDNTPLEIEQDTLEELWKENGSISTIMLSSETLEERASYFLKKNCKMDFYPSFSQPVRTTKGNAIKAVKTIEADYEKVEKLTVGFHRIFKKSKSIVEKINNKEEELQKITYESFKKSKLKLKTNLKKKKFKKGGKNNVKSKRK